MSIKSNGNDYYQPLSHSILLDNKLFFFYDEENLAVIDAETLEDHKTIKVEAKSEETAREFGIISDWSHDQLVLFKDFSIIVFNQNQEVQEQIYLSRKIRPDKISKIGGLLFIEGGGSLLVYDLKGRYVAELEDFNHILANFQNEHSVLMI